MLQAQPESGNSATARGQRRSLMDKVRDWQRRATVIAS
jgi:hypothetical protein